MTHPLIENHADYFAVLARTDSASPKDERFITRAFASSGFSDDDAGDEGVPFTHDETRLTLACDGDVVVFYHPSNGNYAPMPLMYGDVFIALQRMQWSSAALYCAGEAEETLREMAGRIPASYSDFALTAAMPEPSSAEVTELRASIAASPVAQAEPGFMIGSLTEDESPVDHSRRERWGQIVDDEASAQSHDDVPVIPETPPLVHVPREPAPATVPERVNHVEPQTSPQKNRDDLSSFDHERLLIAREREIENLHGIIKQMLLGQSMNQFAAAVLPHDAILIAHLYAPSTWKLELLGFERVYNVYTNEEYGVTVDGVFLVFTKDLAGPDWVETLLNRLGGRIERVWQAVPSLVGTLLAQRVPGSLKPADLRLADAQSVVTQLDEAIGATARENLEQFPDQSGVSAEPGKQHAEPEPRQSVQVEEPAPANHLTVEQQKAIDAMGSTFTTIMREVFKASNETQAVAARVSELEATR